MRIEGVDDPESVQEELVRICREDIEPALVPFIDRIAFDNGRRVVALDIEGKRRPYRTKDGRFYLRIGSDKRETTREELSALMDEARPAGFENMPVIGAITTDIDEAHLWSFLTLEVWWQKYLDPVGATGEGVCSGTASGVGRQLSTRGGMP